MVKKKLNNCVFIHRIAEQALMKSAEKHEISQYFCVEYYLQVKFVN